MLDFKYQEIETSRVLLRKPALNDAVELSRLRSMAAVNEFIDRPKVASEEDCIKTLTSLIQGIESGNTAYWILTELHTGILMGTACVWKINHVQLSAELGCEMFPEFQGKGMMKEALDAIIDFSRKSMKLKHLEAYTDTNNTRSQKLLNTLGFTITSDFTRDNGLLDFVYRFDL